MPIAPAIADAPTAEDAAMDDLEKYLALPVEDNLDLDVLSWWKARDHDQAADPASGRPAGVPDLCQDGGAVSRPPCILGRGRANVL